MALYKVCIRIKTDCEIIKFASREQVIEMLDIRFINEDNVRHLIKIPVNLIRSELVSHPFNKFNVIKINKDKKFCIIDVWKSPCSICRILRDENVYMIKARASKPAIVSYIFTCDEYTLKRIRDIFEANKFEYSIEILNENNAVLTPRQEYILSLAFDLGYFDYPHRITLEELAKILDMSPSALSETLRRAIKRLIINYLTQSKS
jgi:predicted DNA binding protein